jgi:hypothetical protein
VDVRSIRQRACAACGRLAIAAGLLMTVAVVDHPPVSAADDPAGGPPASRSTCQYAPTRRGAQVREGGVREASALVASRQFPGVYWTLNDSGNTPMIYAFDEDGAPRGSFRVTGATNVDWEAIGLGPDGDGGFALYIGDIGDNDQLRRDPVIYRVPEPEPAAPGQRPAAGETAPATPFRFFYPGRPHNAEAMVVHPTTGEILVITRELNGMAMIYSLPLPLHGDGAPIANLVDVVNVQRLDPSSGQVTDAAVSSDGRQLALRTYASVLLYDVPADGFGYGIWGQAPRVYRINDGPKGEGLAFRLDTGDLLSIGEDKAAPASLYETAEQC